MTITLSALANGVIGNAYSQAITASGGTGPYTYAVTAGTLPAGLSLSSGGTLSGTPTVAGYTAFTVTATDSTTATGSLAYTFYVSALVYWFICSNSAYPSAIPVVAGSQPAFNRQVANAVAGLNTTRHEVGDLTVRATAAAIDNHILCDGSAVGRGSFPQLFDVLGTTWGAGDGSTTFNIPNLVTTSLPFATTAPAQTVSSATVSTGGTVDTSTSSGTTATSGGSTGGNISSGGKPQFNDAGTP